MYLALTGLNHKTAPVALREAFSVDEERVGRVLQGVKERGAHEVALLSTCNRTEVFAVSETPESAASAAREIFSTLGASDGPGIATDANTRLESALYHRRDTEVARHLFSVAAGLDSLVVGESQVLGQVRKAYEQALNFQSAGPVLSGLFHWGIRVGKRVRSETGISEGAASISYAAVELARKIFESLQEKRVLIVGAGKMAELAAKNLADQGVPVIYVANRTPAHSAALADAVGGTAVSLTEVQRLLPEVDIVITSTGARAPIIGADDVTRAMRRRKGEPLFIIDIAVPRDVDPQVHTVDGVFLYNIDDLRAVVDANMAERHAWVAEAERIVDHEADRFALWMKERVAVPVIKALREKVAATTQAEVDRVLRRLDHLSEREKDEVRALAHSIAGKLLHRPTVRLKSSVEEGRHSAVFESVSDLFGLDLYDYSSKRSRTGPHEGTV